MSKLTKAIRRLRHSWRTAHVLGGNSRANVGRQLAELKAELLQHQIATKWALMDMLLEERTLPPSVTCPLCGTEQPRAACRVYQSTCIFGGGRLTRYQCSSCDVIFGAEKMLALSKDELSTEYRWHYRAYAEGDSTANEIRAFHLLRPRRDGVYLNFGSGAWSKSLSQLRSEGWIVYGYEPHAQIASEHVITHEDQLRDMQFDGIFSNNVLEHLRHPVEELISMRELLKPDGRMAHATACFEYLYEFTRFHLYFFTGRSRELLASLAGLNTLAFVQDGHFMCQVLGSARESFAAGVSDCRLAAARS